MPKKKVETAVAEEEVSTAVALIQPAFDKLAEFKMPTLEESIVIISKKRKDNEALVITGTDDKVGYEAVKAAMAQMKNDRIAFVDAATENIITPASIYLKKFKDDLEKIANEFKAGEKELRDKKDFIDNEKVRIKAEEELKKVQAMQLRVNELNVLGAMFDGAVYSFAYNETLMIGAGDVKDFSDAEFDDFLEDVKTAFATEQERLENERKEAERQEKQQAEQALLVAQQAIELTAKASVINDKQIALRKKELKLLGAVLSDAGYHFPNIEYKGFISEDSLHLMEDTVWDELMYDIEHFVPATDPLVKDQPEDDGQIPEMMKTQNERLFSELGEDDIDTITEVDFDESVTLAFSTVECPFIDFNISAKFFMRFYPDGTKETAMQGIDKVVNTGRVQGLNIAILSRVEYPEKIVAERDTYNPA